MRDMALSPRKQFFVVNYLVDQNATAAAIRSGVPEQSARVRGCEYLKDPEVQRAIQDAMDERSTRVKIDADFVLNVIVETIERCKQARPVLDRKGNPVFTETPSGQLAAAYTFDAANVLRGAELLGKHLKLFSDRLVVEVSEQPKSLNDFYGETIEGQATVETDT